MAAGIILWTAAASLVVALTGVDEIRIPGHEIRLSNVAAVYGPGAETARRTVIARLSREATAVELSRADVRDLVRRAVPGARTVGYTTGKLTVRSLAPESSSPASKPYVAEPASIQRGQKLTLTAVAGPVVIQRRVVALQDGRREDHRLVRAHAQQPLLQNHRRFDGG